MVTTIKKQEEPAPVYNLTQKASSKEKLISLAVVITAAGSSTRMGGQKKEYLPMVNGSGTILSAATEVFVQAFLPSPCKLNQSQTELTPFLPVQLTKIVITLPPNSGSQGLKVAQDALFASSTLKEIWSSKNSIEFLFVEGGKSRQESVCKALQALQPAPELVLIHDGARPFVSTQVIFDVVKGTLETGAAACGIPPVDTQKEINKEGLIVRHLDRNSLMAIQTPQGFKFNPLLEAHLKAASQNFETTDDTAIWGEFVGPVKITPGSIDNKKITFPSDLDSRASPIQSTKESYMKIRTGLGYDLHRLEEERQLVLGGVTIPFHKGEVGHSDGDALLHAVTDAVLGAAALSDIGELFPPSDNEWKGADSRQLLQTAWKMVQDEGWTLENLDCVVAIEQPKILPHRQAIRESIASILHVNTDQVFIKAKTGEKLGPVGRQEAVEVWVTCLLTKKAA